MDNSARCYSWQCLLPAKQKSKPLKRMWAEVANACVEPHRMFFACDPMTGSQLAELVRELGSELWRKAFDVLWSLGQGWKSTKFSQARGLTFRVGTFARLMVLRRRRAMAWECFRLPSTRASKSLSLMSSKVSRNEIPSGTWIFPDADIRCLKSLHDFGSTLVSGLGCDSNDVDSPRNQPEPRARAGHM